MPDPFGAIIGTTAIILLWLFFKHVDAFSDGNVGADK